MKYPYIVNKDGKWYPAGTEVPADIVESEIINKTYTKTEINRMNVLELKKLGSQYGVKDAESKSGAELKRILIKLMEL